MGPLRSGNTYQKDDGTKRQPANNPGTTESVLIPDGRGLKMKDLSWDSIRRSQETDVTLRKISELLRDPDAPAEVNQFGMGVVHLWNQRKSLEIINGVIHRNYETVEGLILYKQILVPAPLREKFLYGSMGIQHLVISGYRRLPKNYKDMPTGQDGERTRNCLSDAVTNVVGTARDLPVLKDS